MGKISFQFKEGDIRTWNQFHRDFKKAHRFARVGTVNNLAFKTRENVLGELKRTMTIRAPGFVRGSVKVQKASLRKPVSEAGSIKRERFSGWIEQETGKRTDRRRVQTRAARLGNWKRKVAPRFRLKPSAKFIKPADVGLSNNQIVAFLQTLNRKKYRQPFFLPVRYKRLQRGLYLFKGRFPKNKIVRVQSFDPKNVQPVKEPWMSRAVGMITPAVANEEFHKAMDMSIRKSGMLNRYRR